MEATSLPTQSLFSLSAEEAVEQAAGLLANIASRQALDLFRSHPLQVRPENRVRRSTLDQERDAGVAFLSDRGHHSSRRVERGAHLEVQGVCGADRPNPIELADGRRDEFEVFSARAVRSHPDIGAECLYVSVRSS